MEIIKQRTLNEGDFFVFTLNGLKDLYNSGNEKVDRDPLLAVIQFFEKEKIEKCRADILVFDNELCFKTKLYKESGILLENEDLYFSNSFLLNIDSLCYKEESYYSGIKAKMKDTFYSNGMKFNDGDLFAIKLSDFIKRDESVFSDYFNQAINNGLKEGLTHLVLSFHYDSLERKNAGDDLANFVRGFDFDKYIYSSINYSKKPVVRVFLTNNLGQLHYSLSDLQSENYKEIDNNEKFENRIFSNDEYRNSDILGFITTLSEQNLSLITEYLKNDNFIKIGNYHSSEKNYLSVFDMRKYFGEYQRKNMVELDDVEFIVFKKEDLKKEEIALMKKESTHLIIQLAKNEFDDRYTDIFKVEAFLESGNFTLNSENKRSIFIYDLNELIKESVNFYIIKNKDIIKRKDAEIEYNGNYKIIKERSNVLNGIEKGSIYQVKLKDLFETIKDADVLNQLKTLEDFGVSSFLASVYAPLQFLISDKNFENNDRIYIKRERFPEIRLYPVDEQNLYYINMEFLDLFAKDERNFGIANTLAERLKNDKLEKSNSKFELDYVEHIKLNTVETIRFLSKKSNNMKFIVDRKNVTSNIFSALELYRLKAIRGYYFASLEEEKKVKTTIKHKK